MCARRRAHSRSALTALALTCLTCAAAPADTYYWDNPGGGEFTKPDNWDPAGVPGSGDGVIFDLDTATYDVTVTPPAHAIGRLRLDSGTVSLDISGALTASYANGAVLIGWSEGETANVTLAGGVLDSDGSLIIGPINGSSGLFTITGGAVQSAEFDVGSKGAGTLLLQSGGTISSGQAIIASFSNAVGDATVDGGQWTYSGNFSIGWDGVGELAARNGATITQSNTGKIVYVGRTATGNGIALIEGASTTWAMNGQARIGNAGVGELTIRDRALVSGTSAYLGHLATGSGTATVDGGQWDLSDGLYIGGSDSAAAGSGVMTIRSGSTVSVGGQTKLWGDGILLLQGGTLSTDSFRTKLGTFAWTGGTLEVTGDGGLNVGPARHLDSITLTGGKTLTVTGAVTVYSGGALSLAGGTVSCGSLVLAGGTVTTTGTVNLDDFASLSGYGYVNGPVTGGAAVTLTAGGALTLGDASATNGYDVAGTLAVGSNAVTLLDADRARLGQTTTIGSGGTLTGLNGLRLDAGEVLTAGGQALIQGEMLNDGTINGPTAAGEALAFDDDVNGDGSYTGHIEFRQGFMPGSSPGTVGFGGGDVCFAENATLVLEILGSGSGQYDRLTNIGVLDFLGTLQLVFGFTPDSGEAFGLLDFTSLTGSLDNIEVVGLDSSLLDTSALPTLGSVSIVPEPATLALLALGGLALIRNRRKPSAPRGRR